MGFRSNHRFSGQLTLQCRGAPTSDATKPCAFPTCLWLGTIEQAFNMICFYINSPSLALSIPKPIQSSSFLAVQFSFRPREPNDIFRRALWQACGGGQSPGANISLANLLDSRNHGLSRLLSIWFTNRIKRSQNVLQVNAKLFLTTQERRILRPSKTNGFHGFHPSHCFVLVAFWMVAGCVSPEVCHLSSIIEIPKAMRQRTRGSQYGADFGGVLRSIRGR